MILWGRASAVNEQDGSWNRLRRERLSPSNLLLCIGFRHWPQGALRDPLVLRLTEVPAGALGDGCWRPFPHNHPNGTPAVEAALLSESTIWMPASLVTKPPVVSPWDDRL